METLENDESLKPKQREIKLERFTNDWSEANPLLSEKDKAILQNAIDNPTIDNDFKPRAFRRAFEKKQAELGMIPIVASREEYNALPSGSYYRTPSGTTGQKP